MSKFQIVIDCETDHGAFYFMDARGLTRELLFVITAEAESALINGGRDGKPIKVTGSRLVTTNTEFMCPS